MTTNCVPPAYFEIIRCPRCRTSLRQVDAGVRCAGCEAVYEVADGIPVLLTDLDPVGSEMKEFYEATWRGEVGDTAAKRAHEDLSDLGQRYIRDGENRWLARMRERTGEYFVDLGCGAQPRVEAGRGHARHVCVDLSLSGLALCRRILGDRGVYVCGSLLDPPLARGFASTALMAHCLYHVHRDHQPTALRGAYELLLPGGELFILYANPWSLESAALRPLLALKPRHGHFYWEPLPVRDVLTLAGALGPADSEVGTIRAVSKVVSQPLFSMLGRLGYRTLRLMDRLPARLSTYVAYRLRHG